MLNQRIGCSGIINSSYSTLDSTRYLEPYHVGLTRQDVSDSSHEENKEEVYESRHMEPTSPGQAYVNANLQPQNLADIDWTSAPLSFKLYQNCEYLPFPDHDASSQAERVDTVLTHHQVGQLLFSIYGLTRQVWTCRDALAPPGDSEAPCSPEMTIVPQIACSVAYLRPVPSGGALFPCELYLLASSEQALPAGIYHYDVAHHRLALLRAGDCMTLLIRSLAYSGEHPPAYALLYSCLFWKDGFKYGAFSYRLQGLDIGTVLAQSTIVAASYGLRATVHYQFLDLFADALLDIDPLYESLYAIVTLQSMSSSRSSATTRDLENVPEGPSQESVMPQAPLLESLSRLPMAEAVHRASLIESPDAFQDLEKLSPILPPEGIGRRSLPRFPPLDLRAAHWHRHSATGLWLQGALTEEQCSRMLSAGMEGYCNDVDGSKATLQHILLYLVINVVQDIPAGIYCYRPQQHELTLIRAGDMRQKLQHLLYGPHRLSMMNVSLCLIPVGHYDDGFQVYGDRWYRMQQMEAGILVQRLYLAAATFGLGCRANLGYQNRQADALLRLPIGYKSLIQIMIGRESHQYQRYEQSVLL
jgi:SagB-type dehydrogenase family enzyme